MSVSNIQLQQLADSLKIPLAGIVMKNQLIDLPAKQGYYIVNLQSSFEGGGTHWTAVVLGKGKCLYFDSYGALPPLEVIDFMKRSKGRGYTYNESIIQAMKSELCGFYCMGLFLYLSRNSKKPIDEAMEEFCDTFTYDESANDHILAHILLKEKIPPFAKRLLKTEKVAY
jgi:hypothetical protein